MAAQRRKGALGAMLHLFGPIAGHMALHILLMNAAAPLLVLLFRDRIPPGAAHHLGRATLVQLALLWGWHAPGVLEAVLASEVLHIAMQASLFAAALWFWAAIVAATRERAWRSLLALLVTSKLFCMLGVLMVFAPRALYAILPAGHMHHAAIVDVLADQQLAGLLMLVACPATYLLAGVIVATRWIGGLEGGAVAGRRYG